MMITQVDERTHDLEFHHARYRVYIHESGADSTHGSTETFDIVGGDILQVIDWAQRHADRRRTYAIALVLSDEEVTTVPGSTALVWVVGCDGNDIGDLYAQQHSRMLSRRDDPVHVPPSGPSTH